MMMEETETLLVEMHSLEKLSFLSCTRAPESTLTQLWCLCSALDHRGVFLQLTFKF